MTYNPGEPRDDRDEHRSTAPLIVVVVLLLILVGLLGVWLYKSLSTDPSARPGPTSSTTRVQHTPLTAVPTSTATTTVTPSETPKETVTATQSVQSVSSPSTAPATSQMNPAAQLPQGAKFCGIGLDGVRAYAGNNATSCDFALAVGKKQGPTDGPLHVQSPVTGRTYTVTCSGGNGTYATCTGGDNAVVYLVWNSR